MQPTKNIKNKNENIPAVNSAECLIGKSATSICLNKKVTECVATWRTKYLAESYSLLLKCHNSNDSELKANHNKSKEHYRDAFDSKDIINNKLCSFGWQVPGSLFKFMLLSKGDRPIARQCSEEIIRELILSNKLLVIFGKKMVRSLKNIKGPTA